MRDDHKRRKQVQEAVTRVGEGTLPSRQLEGTFKHEGNRHFFSILKNAEEEYLLHAIMRQDRFGNVTAGGPDSIAEGHMRLHAQTMRDVITEIVLDGAEADDLVHTFTTLVRKTFTLPEGPARTFPRGG